MQEDELKSLVQHYERSCARARVCILMFFLPFQGSRGDNPLLPLRMKANKKGLIICFQEYIHRGR